MFCFALSVIPQVQLAARTRGAHPTEKNGQQSPKEFTSGIHPQFPARGHNWFVEDRKPAELLQRKREKNFFADEQGFVEPSDCIEIFPSGEQESSGAKFLPKINS